MSKVIFFHKGDIITVVERYHGNRET